MCMVIQARIAQLVAYRLGTGDVLGSNPGMGENFSVKISVSRSRYNPKYLKTPPRGSSFQFDTKTTHTAIYSSSSCPFDVSR